MSEIRNLIKIKKIKKIRKLKKKKPARSDVTVLIY